MWPTEINNEYLKKLRGNVSEFKQLLCGNFEVDQRYIDLHERLEKYYRDTPDEMSNRDAMPHWRLFKQWAADRGYTQDEINHAKINIKV